MNNKSIASEYDSVLKVCGGDFRMTETPPSTEIYKFSGKYLIPTYTVCIIASAGFAFILFLIMGWLPWIEPPRVKPPLWGSIPGIYMIVVTIYAGTSTYLGARPLILSPDGVSVFLFGKSKRFISWKNVAKIQKRQFYSPAYNRPRTQYKIYGSGRTIFFDDGICDLPRLLASLNRRIAEHEIPVFSIDQSRATVAGLRKTILDPEERKKIIGQEARQTFLEP